MEEQLPAVDTHMATTTFTLEGYRIERYPGIIVRSRSIFGTVGAGLQTLVGGDISLFTNLCEKTRARAFQRMTQHAARMGANAIVGVRYDGGRYGSAVLRGETAP
jgi:uncharacterized protein YbjQ (UPF0145 family)